MTPPPVMAPVRAREPILGWLLVGAGLGFCFLGMLTIGAFTRASWLTRAGGIRQPGKD